ncbi:Beta-lactamase domain-containing protein 2 [Penicillium subrubescens]|jgi:CubicO group peptidase (beta-lactamase class C family)|uniref:Beta-lactamase domain-containing protein 2 n=1 Tax=Penicillium subrubescens TaxID=1316194 RepID=A0A1Q5T2V2_9EURO|nr:Beta-lactamase domain-containing protein 2 [Penicillium subrubescens]
MAEVHGNCDPAFESVRELLQQRLASGDEIGASLCINIDGKNVVDIWGGHADETKTRPWDEDTITVIWSSSKVITNLAANVLIDRGLLNANEKVATYWPEFAANGKEDVKVSHILSHTSGVSAWAPGITLEEILDIEGATAKLAEMAPLWTPGELNGYHLLSQGHLVGEIVRRVSGKSLNQFIVDEIAGPLGADYRLGLPKELYPRAADIVPFTPSPPPAIDPTSIAARSYAGTPMSPSFPTAPNTAAFRENGIGGIGGFSNARALARIGSMVSLNGTVDGKQYLSPKTIDDMLQEQVAGVDAVLFHYFRFGLGVALPSPQSLPWIPEGRIGFWGGWGGSFILMDLDRRMTIGYVMNKMHEVIIGNERTTHDYVREIYKVVDQLK